MKDNWLKPMKLAAMRMAPSAYANLQSWFYRRKYIPIHERIDGRYGRRIAGGPFAGMEYLAEAAGSMVLPKLLGTYEAELHGVISEAAGQKYRAIIDVGCAEGYYAVGLALKFPGVPVFAYDIEERARQLCSELAAINGVAADVQVSDACHQGNLRAMADRRALVVCDCEGFELELFDDQTAPLLEQWDLLIELHEFIHCGVTSELQRRFAATHSARLIPVSVRSMDDFPTVQILSAAAARRAMDEGRPANQHWLWLKSKTAWE